MSRETVSAQYIPAQHRIPEKTHTASTGRLLVEDGIAYEETAIELKGS